MSKDLKWFTKMKRNEKQRRVKNTSLAVSHESIVEVHSSSESEDGEVEIWKNLNLSDSPFRKQQLTAAATIVAKSTVEETKSPAGLEDEDEGKYTPSQIDTAKMFLLYHAKGSISAALSTLLVISLYSAMQRTRYLALFGIVASLQEWVALTSMATLTWASAKTSINTFAICNIAGILSVIGWVIYLLPMMLINTDDQILTSVLIAQVLFGFSGVQQILAMEVVRLCSVFSTVTNQKVDVLSTDLTHSFGRLYLGPCLALLLALVPTSYVGIFNELSAPGWLGLCVATLSLAAAFLPLNGYSYLADLSGASTPLRTHSANESSIQVLQQQQQQQQQQQLDIESSTTNTIHSPRTARQNLFPRQSAATAPALRSHLMSSSPVSAQEVILATGDFMFQFCYYGWLWTAQAWYIASPNVQSYSSFNIYLPVIIGLSIGWIFPHRQIHQLLCINMRCNPYSAEFTSCCLACVFLLCSFLLLATQRSNEVTSQAFVFSTGILAGLGGSLYFLASDYLIVNFAFIRSRHTISRRIRAYMMVSTAGRALGILVLGSMLSNDTGKIEALFNVSLFISALLLMVLSIVIFAGTRKSLLPESTRFRKNALSQLIAIDAYDENVV